MNQPAAPQQQGSSPNMQPPQQVQVPAATVGVQPTIYLSQEPYYLQQVEYERIKRGQPAAASAAMNIFLTGIGAAVTVLAQEIAHLSGKAGAVDPIALYSVIGTVLLSGAAWVFIRFFPSDYTRTMEAIGEHFKKSPIVRHFGNKP